MMIDRTKYLHGFLGCFIVFCDTFTLILHAFIPLLIVLTHALHLAYLRVKIGHLSHPIIIASSLISLLLFIGIWRRFKDPRLSI